MEQVRTLEKVANVLALWFSAAIAVLAYGALVGPILGVPVRLWSTLIVLCALLAPVRRRLAFRNRDADRQLERVSCGLTTLVGLAGPLLGLWAMKVWFVPPPSVLLMQCVLTYAAVRLLRAGVHRMEQRLRGRRRVLVCGDNPSGQAIAHEIAQHGGDMEVVGFIGGAAGRGSFDGVQARDLDGVIVALPKADAEELGAVIARLRLHFRNIYLPPPATVEPQEVSGERVGALALLTVGVRPPVPLGLLVKRMLDIAIAGTALFLLLPLLAAVALAIKLESPGPVIYVQRRFGLNNRLFACYKFRTLKHGSSNGLVLTQRNDSRVSRIGGFLRRTSIDELPQLVNVLQGHMSMVGPRPHPPGVRAGERLYEEIVDNFAERYRVRPGITGWAQVNGLRGNTFTEQHLELRFRDDIEYISNWSIELELLILFRTILGGFMSRNAF